MLSKMLTINIYICNTIRSIKFNIYSIALLYLIYVKYFSIPTCSLIKIKSICSIYSIPGMRYINALPAFIIIYFFIPSSSFCFINFQQLFIFITFLISITSNFSCFSCSFPFVFQVLYST